MSEELERKDIDPSKIDWNAQAERWDDYDEAQDYNQTIFKLLSEHVDVEGMRVLDFGCGTGLLTDLMQGKAKEIVAIDAAEKMIEVLSKKNYPNVTAIHAELSDDLVRKHDSLQQPFDLIVASSVCAFVPNYLEVLSTIKSLLKLKALFVQWDWLTREDEEGSGFSEERIRESYQQVGLEVKSVTVPFYMEEKGWKMEVLMAVGQA